MCKNVTKLLLCICSVVCDNGDAQSATCTDGVLSSSGYAVYNDGKNNVFDAYTGGWADSVHKNAPHADQDLYIFMYDKDYHAALKSLASVSGKMALPPRRFFGVRCYCCCGSDASWQGYLYGTSIIIIIGYWWQSIAESYNGPHAS